MEVISVEIVLNIPFKVGDIHSINDQVSKAEII